MAKDIVAANLVMNLKAGVADFRTKIAQAKADVKGLGDSVEENKEKFDKAGKSLIVIGGSISAVLALSTAAAIEFNRELGNIETLIPGQTQRLQELKGAFQDMSIQVGKSTTDLTQGGYQVISAFGDTADTVKILETAAKGASAGVATTTEAINLLSAVTKGYGDTSAEAVSKASDLAFQTVKLGQTTFPELAASMGRVVPLAAELGVTQEELFAVMATGTGVTGGAAEVSTQLRGALQALMAPSADMQKLIAGLGYESGKAMLQQNGLKGSLDLMVKSAQASGLPLQQLIGSIEGQTIALALTGSQSDVYVDKLGQMGVALGATEEAFKAQTEGVNATGFQLQTFKMSVIVLAQTIGDQLLPIIGKIAGAFRDVIKGVIDWMKEHPKFAKAITVTAAGLGAIATVAGAILVALPPLIAGIKALGWTLSAAGPLGLALGALAVAVGLVAAYWDELGIIFKAVYNNIIKPVIDFILNEVKMLQIGFKWFTDWLAREWENVMLGLMHYIGPVVEFIGEQVEFMWEAWKLAWERIGTFVAWTLEKVYSGVRWVLDKLGVEIPEFDIVWNSFGTGAEGAAEKSKFSWKGAIDDIKAGFAALKDDKVQNDDQMELSNQETLDTIAAQTDGFIIADEEKKKKSREKEKTETEVFLEWLGYAYEGHLTEQEAKTVDSLRQMGLDWEGYAERLAGKDAEDTESTMGMIRARYGGFLTEQEINTAAALEKMGEDWMLYADGIVAEGGVANTLRQRMQETFANIKDTSIASLKNIGEGFVADILSGNIKGAFDHLKSGFSEAFQNVKKSMVDTLTKGLTDWIGDQVKSLASGFWNALSSGQGGFFDSIGGALKSVLGGGSAASGAGGALSGVTGAIGTVGSTIGSGISSVGGAIAGAAGALGIVGTLGVGAAVAGAILGLKALFGGPSKDSVRKTEDGQTFEALINDVETGVASGKYTEEQAKRRIAMLEEAIQGKEITVFLRNRWAAVQNTTSDPAYWKARNDYLTSHNMRDQGKRTKSFMDYLDAQMNTDTPVDKFHAGGVVGGRLGQERMIIAQAGEEVLTRNDPRHQMNSGIGGITINITGNNIGSDMDLNRIAQQVQRSIMQTLNERAKVARL